MKLTIHSEYTSVACNRIPTVVDWNSNGLLCYGATNAVIVYDPFARGKDPSIALAHHKSRVNSVKWLERNVKSCTELLSCSNDNTAVIWSLFDGQWKVTSSLVGHTGGVTCIDGLYTNMNDVLVYTASIDSSINIWERIKDKITCKQTISLGSGLCLTLKTHLLSAQKPILFCALDDFKIHIFAPVSIDDTEHHRLHVLSGHEDWVRGLDVLNVDDKTILLASCSQDTHIRLWRIQQHVQNLTPTHAFKTEEKIFNAYGSDYSVKLDAVLSGHEGWVYGVQWHPQILDSATNTLSPVYRLLSSSLDKTLIVWEPDFETEENKTEDSGVWVEKVRVGEVGGNGLGFYGSKFGPDGKSFMGHGYNGSFHIWKLDEKNKQWKPTVVCGGHFSEVSDMRWEPSGRYLTSVSTDQTTRLHAPWQLGKDKEWHEIARPQVHGYDMSSIALVNSTTFVSAAEEKVIRVFEAPHNFLNNFENITGQNLVAGKDYRNGSSAPEGASVPSLGLSNKAVYNGDTRDPADKDNDGYFVAINLTEPPTEETLMQNTLWPEAHKLYGHGYEVFCLDASSDGTLVASACKATTAEHAAILLWETSNWQQIQKLVSHQLTVTQLAFSPDSQQLLSVSRDRKWTIFHRAEGGNSFAIAASSDKSNGVHTRIIWCCAWSFDSVVFGTGSRDGKVCLWTKTGEVTETSLKQYSLLGKPLDLPNTSVTALALAPSPLPPSSSEKFRLVAVGLDNGCIKLYTFHNNINQSWTLMHELDNSSAHHLTVKRLMFKPHNLHEHTSNELKLASCGTDHLVRIYSVRVQS